MRQILNIGIRRGMGILLMFDGYPDDEMSSVGFHKKNKGRG